MRFRSRTARSGGDSVEERAKNLVCGWISAQRERFARAVVIYRMPESAKARCKMVSLTAAKTRRMLEVSVACVRLLASVQHEDGTRGLTEDRDSGVRG